MSFPNPEPAVARACETLHRGTAFFAQGPGRAGWTGGAVHARVLANGLRELDRFLSVLLDAVAAAHCPELRVEHLRNTANKLELVHRQLGLPPPDRARWRAMGRCRACLFFTAGRVRTADSRSGTGLTLAWPDGDAAAARTVPIGELLCVAAADIAWLCRYYDDAARTLVAAVPLPAAA